MSVKFLNAIFVEGNEDKWDVVCPGRLKSKLMLDLMKNLECDLRLELNMQFSVYMTEVVSN